MAAVQPAASRGRVLVQAEVEPAEVCKWVALLSKLGVGNNVLAPKESAVLEGLTSWLAGLVPDAQNNLLGLTAARAGSNNSKDDCLYYNDFLQSWQAAMPATRGTALGKQPISVSWMQALTSVAVHKAATAWKAKLQARPDTRDPAALEAELHNISDWDTYDALKVRELSHGRPLELTALSLIIKLQLDTRLKLDLNKLRTFLASIEAQYPSDNPYHNAMHAADVVQGVGCIITADEFGQKLTDLEVLALILSAVVHDVAHPGVNNIFLVRAETEAALHYNDNSVNENTHLVKAFSTLRENNFLEGLNDEDRRFLRRLIIEMVLGTDMAFHNAMLKDFANRMTLAGSDIETWENEGRAALLKFVLHAADISNPARPWTVCRFWAQQITTENFLQGERERQAGLTVSPMCDKEKAVPIKSQQIFCELFVKPTFQTLSAIAPNISAKALGHCATNSTRYQAYADKGLLQIPVE